MKQIVILATAIAFSLTTIGYVYGLPPAVKEGKALVKTLPKGVEGVELVANKVRLKSGFKFVKNPKGTVTVARMAGGGHGLGVSGEWICSCSGNKGESGTCSTIISNDTLSCLKGGKDTCNGTCKLLVIVRGVTTGVIAY